MARSVAAAVGGAGEEEEGDRFVRAADGRGIFDIFLDYGKLGRLFLQVCHHVAVTLLILSNSSRSDLICCTKSFSFFYFQPSTNIFTPRQQML